MRIRFMTPTDFAKAIRERISHAYILVVYTYTINISFLASLVSTSPSLRHLYINIPSRTRVRGLRRAVKSMRMRGIDMVVKRYENLHIKLYILRYVDGSIDVFLGSGNTTMSGWGMRRRGRSNKEIYILLEQPAPQTLRDMLSTLRRQGIKIPSLLTGRIEIKLDANHPVDGDGA